MRLVIMGKNTGRCASASVSFYSVKRLATFVFRCRAAGGQCFRRIIIMKRANFFRHVFAQLYIHRNTRKEVQKYLLQHVLIHDERAISGGSCARVHHLVIVRNAHERDNEFRNPVCGKFADISRAAARQCEIACGVQIRQFV